MRTVDNCEIMRTIDIVDIVSYIRDDEFDDEWIQADAKKLFERLREGGIKAGRKRLDDARLEESCHSAVHAMFDYPKIIEVQREAMDFIDKRVSDRECPGAAAAAAARVGTWCRMLTQQHPACAPISRVGCACASYHGPLRGIVTLLSCGKPRHLAAEQMETMLEAGGLEAMVSIFKHHQKDEALIMQTLNLIYKMARSDGALWPGAGAACPPLDVRDPASARADASDHFVCPLIRWWRISLARAENLSIQFGKKEGIHPLCELMRQFIDQRSGDMIQLLWHVMAELCKVCESGASACSI